MKKTVMIAGPISKIPLYNQRAFDKAAEVITDRGDIALNPRILPLGMEAEQYMKITLAMVEVADLIVLLPGWQKSPGALAEKRKAEGLGIRVIEFSEYLGISTSTNQSRGVHE